MQKEESPHTRSEGSESLQTTWHSAEQCHKWILWVMSQLLAGTSLLTEGTLLHLEVDEIFKEEGNFRGEG